ncbi:MAG TPA: helix-turn-helix domain-containing protein [Verrucomicrobiae bacterium]
MNSINNDIEQQLGRPQSGLLAPAPAATTQEEFITKEEVAHRLKKTKRTVEKWQRCGVIPFYKVGNAIFYRWSDIVVHLQRHFRFCRPAAPLPEPQHHFRAARCRSGRKRERNK